ncbi:hypothetical protein BH20VER1_BH20VER1_31480 [soil metagenome]|jgi:hypothetical protein
MKKLLIAAFVIGFSALGHNAEAQTARGTFTAPATPEARRDQVDQRRVPPPTRTREVGAVPRAARGNPAQILNPLAPQRYYAPPEETVVADPQNPERTVGLILFGLRW